MLNHFIETENARKHAARFSSWQCFSNAERVDPVIYSSYPDDVDSCSVKKIMSHRVSGSDLLIG